MTPLLLAAVLTVQAQHPLYIYPRPEQWHTEAVPIKKVAPEYSAEARKAKISGIVILRALVEKDGTVSATRVEKPLPFGLSGKAEEAVKRWKFKPCKDRFGRATRCTYIATVNFKLP